MTESEAIQSLKNRLKTEVQRYGENFVKENFDDICFAISVFKEIQKYREMDRKLREIYGECDGLLEKAVNLLCDHKGIDVGRPIKSRLLTDEDVDKWIVYTSIGTVEECREATEKQKAKKPIPINYRDYVNKIDNAEFLEGSYFCPNCKTVLRHGSYCNRCGQKLDFEESEEE